MEEKLTQMSIQLEEFGKKLDVLLAIVEKKDKPCWVSVGFVTKLTGWGHDDLRRARVQGLITAIKNEDSNSLLYDINSLSSKFILNKI